MAINISKVNNCKKILQYDKQGNFIKEWKSAKEVEDILNIKSENISSVCLKKKSYHTAGGFVWRFKYEKKRRRTRT